MRFEAIPCNVFFRGGKAGDGEGSWGKAGPFARFIWVWKQLFNPFVMQMYLARMVLESKTFHKNVRTEVLKTCGGLEAANTSLIGLEKTQTRFEAFLLMAG